MSGVTPETVRELLAGATPGPWRFNEDRGVGATGEVEAAATRTVIVYDLHRSPERDGNGRLIAAGPDIAQEYLDQADRIAAVRALHFPRGRNILGYPVCDACTPLQPMPCPTLRALGVDR